MQALVSLLVWFLGGQALKKKQNSRTQITKHHILPRAKNGGDEKKNIAKVMRYKHRRYHLLFKNKSPIQIICFLVEYFWRGNWEFVEQALKRSKR